MIERRPSHPRRGACLAAVAALLGLLCAPPAAAAPQGQDKDMETIKQRLVASLLPSSAEGAKAVSDQARSYAGRLAPDGSWPDVDYEDKTPGGWRTSRHLSYVSAMARAWRAGDAAAKANPELQAKLLAGLDHWLQHDFINPNWWHNQVGVPMTLGETLLVIDDLLTPERRAKGAAILDRATLTKVNKGALTGANLVWLATNQLYRGLVEGSLEVVIEALNAIFSEMKVMPTGREGIQADWSFHQHGPLIYAGGYGAAYTGSCVRFVEYAHGTRFAPTPEQISALVNYVLDGQQWMIRGTYFDYGVVGREIVRAGKSARGIEGAADRLAKLRVSRWEELAGFASRMRGEPAAAPLTGNRHYWKSDYMVHHRAGYFASARMHSTRIANTDGFTNGEGRQSHHVADGAALIYRRGDEYRDIFPVWEWRRVPGTTAEQRPEPLEPRRVRRMGKTRFVGGVSDGTYGLAAMDLACDALTARKAWFYFDEAFVCLGAGITCAGENPVFTAVNQCLLNGDVRAAGREGALPAGEHDLGAARWIEHDGVTYAFPAGGALYVKVGPQTGSWSNINPSAPAPVTRDVFSAWLDHGRNVNGGTYTYVVLPGHAGRAPETDAELGRIEILSNTPALQAARHTGLKMVQAAFYEPGKLSGGRGWNLSVDQACLVLLRETDGGVQLSVANPENKPLAVTVTVDRALAGEGCSPAGEGGTAIRFELPGGEDAGRSVTRVARGR